MSETNAGTWLLVGIAILGVLVAVPLISAHGDGIAPEEPSENWTEQDRHDEQPIRMPAHGETQPDGNVTTWMAAHMGINASEWQSAHDGTNATAWMAAHMGVNASEWQSTHMNATAWSDGHASVNESEWPGDGDSVGSHPHAPNDGDATDRHDERGGMYGGGHGC